MSTDYFFVGALLSDFGFGNGFLFSGSKMWGWGGGMSRCFGFSLVLHRADCRV